MLVVILFSFIFTFISNEFISYILFKLTDQYKNDEEYCKRVIFLTFSDYFLSVVFVLSKCLSNIFSMLLSYINLNY